MINTMTGTLRRTASGASDSMGQATGGAGKTAKDAATGIGKTVSSAGDGVGKVNSMGQGARNVFAGMSGGQGK